MADRSATMMTLVRPARRYLPSYIAALEGGWAPASRAGAREQELTALADDPDAVIARLNNNVGPDLLGFTRFLWDGDFCGRIAFRYHPGQTAPPPDASGHIGYGVVAEKRGRGYATAALRLLLEEISGLGLPSLLLTTDPENIASQRVIIANGGVRAGEEMHLNGGRPIPLLVWRIGLPR